jgi:hypothetical protein
MAGVRHKLWGVQPMPDGQVKTEDNTVPQASNKRSSLVMHRACATSRARRDSLTSGGGVDDEDGDEESGSE